MITTAQMNKAIDLDLVALKQATYDLLSLIDAVTKRSTYTEVDIDVMKTLTIRVAAKADRTLESMDYGVLDAQGGLR